MNTAYKITEIIFMKILDKNIHFAGRIEDLESENDD